MTNEAATTMPRLGISYPPSFSSSFWTYPDYRKGAVVLYSRLQEGLDENETVLLHMQHRVNAEYAYARSLAQGQNVICSSDLLFPGAADRSRSRYDNYSSLTAQAMRETSNLVSSHVAAQHFQVAKELDEIALESFSAWVVAHTERVHGSWRAVDDALAALEAQSLDATKKQSAYETRCQYADEAEDDVRFAPKPHVFGAQKESDSAQEDECNKKSDDPQSQAARTPSATSNSESKKVSQEVLLTVEDGLEKDAEKSKASNQVPLEQKEADAQKLKRRETIRQQFGFKERKRPNTHEQHDLVHPSSERPPQEQQQQHHSRLSSYWNLTKERVQESPALAQVRAAMTGLSEPRHIRLRREADLAEKAYRESVMLHDKLRCEAEEVLFREYKRVQKWEYDRAIALQRVLALWQKIVGRVTSKSDASMIMSINPASHIQQLVFDFRTGPFRPAAMVFKPYYHDDMRFQAGTINGGFGMDLITAAKSVALQSHKSALSGQGISLAMPNIPPVLHVLLSALQRSYAESSRWVPPNSALSDAKVNAEKRRIWLYDVPLTKMHELRRELSQFYNSNQSENANESSALDQMLDAVDAPVLAATVKLWLLELHSPLLTFSLWDKIVALYEANHVRISSLSEESNNDALNAIDETHLRGLSEILGHLPKLHLTCLDSLVSHLYKLLKLTSTEDDDDMYLAKLGLSMGRCVLRPDSTLPSLVFSDVPALLFRDLVKNYETLLPPIMQHKVKESDSKGLSPYKVLTLQRHRPALVDERIKRSSLPGLGLPKEALQRRATQLESRHMSTPNVRTLVDTTTANEKATVSRSATLSHMQLISGPLHDTAYISSKQEIKGNVVPAISNRSPEEAPKTDVLSSASVHANRSKETDNIDSIQRKDEYNQNATDVSSAVPELHLQSMPDAKEVDIPRSPMDLEQERKSPSGSPSHGRFSSDASPNATPTTSQTPLRARPGGVRGPRGPRKASK